MLIQSGLPLRIAAAVEEDTGELTDVAEPLGWLLDLVSDLSTELIGQCWRPETFTALHRGTDALGRKLPAVAAVIAQRLGWIPHPQEGLYLPSRVMRLAQANVVSILKTMAYRDRLLPRVAAAIDEHGHLNPALLDEACRDGSPAFVRNVARQLRGSTGGEGQIESITEIQPVPAVPRIARFGAVDAQLAHLDAAADHTAVRMRVKLPISAAPVGRPDWRWFHLWCPIPAHVKGRDIRIWHMPTVTMHRGAPLFRFAISEAVPDSHSATATAALGIDWSPASLGAATTVADRDGRLVTDARTHVYNDRGLGHRLARLQTEGQRLGTKIDRLTRLAAGAPEPTQAGLHAKIAVLQQHRAALGAKRRRINREIAFDFAKTMTAMATASGAGVIAVEDLRSLQPRGWGPTNNDRAAQSARRQACRALEHTAARAGLEVVMCPPRGTSARCPGCDGELARPDGYHSARCAACGITNANRDQIASQNIAKRVLLAKTGIKRPKNKPKRVTTVAHRRVTKTRQKTTATPKQLCHKRTRHSTPIDAPTQRTHPARQVSVWDRDQQTGTRKAPLRNPSPRLAASQSPSEYQRPVDANLPSTCLVPWRRCGGGEEHR